MNTETGKRRRMRIAAAVCAVMIITGGAAGINMLRTEASSQEAPEEKEAVKDTAEKKDDGIISAGGTVTSDYLTDDIGMKDTSVRLTVEEVIAEAGDPVIEGTQLYKLTSESLEKAEKTLRSELQSAENALLEKTTSHVIEKGKASSLYESEMLLGTTAQTDYDSDVSTLDSELQAALDAYNEALNTVNNNPYTIAADQTILAQDQSIADSLSEKKASIQSELDKAKENYSAAADSLNAVVSEYNSAASVVRYLGKALGTDVSDVVNAQTVSVRLQEQSSSDENKMPDEQQVQGGELPAGDKNDKSDKSKSTTDSKPSAAQQSTQSTSSTASSSSSSTSSASSSSSSSSPAPAESEKPVERSESSDSTEKTPSGSGFGGSVPEGFTSDGVRPDESGSSDEDNSDPENEEKQENAENKAKEEKEKAEKTEQQSSSDNGLSAVKALCEQARAEYDSLKGTLTEKQAAFESAEKEYNELAEQQSQTASELKEVQNTISSLNKEINELDSSLSKAKSNLTQLKKEYTTLKESYDTDLLELQNKLDTDNASYENAEYHYKITLATLDSELEEAQTAYDTAAENLRIFEEDLADGYIKAKQAGTLYSLTCKEGGSVNVSSAYANYVDTSSFETTVELDQTDVTQVSIGDSVIIYSSESGVSNGRITAISAGTQKSLADVRFNVTVAANEGSSLYSGQSVNVYFNYSGMTGGFADFSANADRAGGESKGGRGENFTPGGDFPGFGGDMPEGFDPSNMPGFDRRKEE